MVAGGDLLESVEAQAANKKPPEGHEMPLGTRVCVWLCVMCLCVCGRVCVSCVWLCVYHVCVCDVCSWVYVLYVHRVCVLSLIHI